MQLDICRLTAASCCIKLVDKKSWQYERILISDSWLHGNKPAVDVLTVHVLLISSAKTVNIYSSLPFLCANAMYFWVQFLSGGCEKVVVNQPYNTILRHILATIFWIISFRFKPCSNEDEKREFVWKFSQLSCHSHTSRSFATIMSYSQAWTRNARELIKSEKREFMWEFSDISQLLCPGQTRLRI